MRQVAAVGPPTPGSSSGAGSTRRCGSRRRVNLGADARAIATTTPRKRAPMRSLALLLCALMLGITVVAWADSLADLRAPSSTIPGCVNNWGLFGTGSGIAEPTCEGKAALTEWNNHAAAISAASDTLAKAANWPDKTAPRAVIDALEVCAAAADAMSRLYHPVPSAPHDDAAVWGGWNRARASQIADTRSRSATGSGSSPPVMAQPGLRRQQRNALYGLAAIFASRESVLAAERGAEVEHRTDEAVRAAHRAAVRPPRMPKLGLPQKTQGRR